MATIRDVAQKAGVSTATVSNVLNGRTDRVGGTTSERVLAAVRALKYKPTPLEHKQRTISTLNIGFIVPDAHRAQFTGHGYFQDILEGVIEGAASQGYSITIFVEKIWDDVGLAIRRSYDGRCDGLIMVAPQPGNELFEMLHARGTPIVTVGSTPWLANVSSVDIDNRMAGAMAARHLVELCHRRLAFATTGRPQIAALERYEGFVKEAARLGLPAASVAFLKAEETPGHNNGEALWALLQDLDTLPTAVVCWNDGLALELIKALACQECKVPEHISVLGIDDIPESDRAGLTTFKNPTYELGKRAAKALIDRLAEGHEVSEAIRYAPELVLRTSTGRPRADI